MMDMSKISVTTEVRGDDLNDIHIHIQLTGHASEPKPRNFYVVGVVDYDSGECVYTAKINDHMSGEIIPFDPEHDARRALDKIVEYLIDYAVEHNLGGAQSLRILQAG